MPMLKRRLSNRILKSLPRKVRDNLYRGRSISNIVQVSLIGAGILLIEYWLLNYWHWWSPALGQEVLALVVADLPIGVIIAGVLARRWRRTGSVEEVEYTEAERRYDHLVAYFLKGEKAGDPKRYVVWNREGKAKGKLAWYARQWVRNLAVIDIIHTEIDWDTIETIRGKQGLRDVLKSLEITLRDEVASNEELEREG